MARSSNLTSGRFAFFHAGRAPDSPPPVREAEWSIITGHEHDRIRARIHFAATDQIRELVHEPHGDPKSGCSRRTKGIGSERPK